MIDIYRMGMIESGKVRSMKIEFSTPDDVDFAIVNSRKLKDGVFKINLLEANESNALFDYQHSYTITYVPQMTESSKVIPL